MIKAGHNVHRFPQLGGLLGNPQRYIGIFEGDANELKESCWGYVTGSTTNVKTNTGIIEVYAANGSATQTIYNIFTGDIYNRTLLFQNGGFNKWGDWRKILTE